MILNITEGKGKNYAKVRTFNVSVSKACQSDPNRI